MNINYKKAPAWADEVFYRKGDSDYYFGNKIKYQHPNGSNHTHTQGSLAEISKVERWVRIPLNLENI